MKRLLATALSLAAVAAPASALACGGFFCSTSPVDQQAERIIFRQPTPNTVESYVEIQYQGDPQAFAWIVPVPGVPRDMTTFSPTAFQILDLATGPTFQIPDECQIPFPSAAEGDFAGGAGDAPQSGNGVEVLDHQIVGDYEITTVAATKGQVLTEWLRLNGYRILDNMVPFIDLYLGEGLNFVAVKLLPGKDTTSIKPLKMVYDSTSPMVPLRLTSIAAVPEMGVKVFLLGPGRYTTTSVPELEVDPADIVYDPFSATSNWPAAVARTIDASQGEGMVADSAAPADVVRDAVANTFAQPIGDEDPEAARAQLLKLFDDTGYVTRLYGRYSAEEMGLDLTFGLVGADDALGDVDRNRILTVEQVPACGDFNAGAPDPCAYVACGQGGVCITSPDENGVMVPGCACVDGAAARGVVDSNVPGGSSVSCVDTRMNVDPVTPGGDDTVEPGGGEVIDVTQPPSLPDPCIANPCGEKGTCFSLNAQQTCLCEHGYVAIAKLGADGKLGAVCREPSQTVPVDFYRRTLPEPRLPFPGKSPAGALSGGDDGCSTTGGGHASLLWLVLGAPLLRRRRRV
jgi:MYXO-CTERM domain-containing protein